jgi:hypothetical protein
MPFKSIVLAGFLLAIISIIAISFGENLLFYLGPYNTITIQTPLALLIAMLLFFFYIYILNKIEYFDVKKYSINDGFLILSCAIVWSPVLYFLLNYYTKGIWVNWKAIFSVLFWQIPANLLMICILNCVLLKWKC